MLDFLLKENYAAWADLGVEVNAQNQDMMLCVEERKSDYIIAGVKISSCWKCGEYNAVRIIIEHIEDSYTVLTVVLVCNICLLMWFPWYDPFGKHLEKKYIEMIIT